MNEWISVKEKLPPLFEIVWIYWRDREVHLGCRTADDGEPHECWYSFEDEKCKWTNWWMSNLDARCDHPMPPDYVEEPSNCHMHFKRYDPLTPYGEACLIKEVD